MIRYPVGRVRIGRVRKWAGQRREDLRSRRLVSAMGSQERPVSSTKDWQVNCYASEAACDILADCHDACGVVAGTRSGSLDTASEFLSAGG